MPYTSKRKAADSGNSRKRAAVVSTGKNDNDNQIFDLGKNKKVRVSKFKGALLVDIREYYTGANEESLPGKKGISLSSELWKNLLDLQTQINEAIISIDPTAGKDLFSTTTSTVEEEQPENDDDDDDEKEEQEEKKQEDIDKKLESSEEND